MGAFQAAFPITELVVEMGRAEALASAEALAAAHGWAPRPADHTGVMRAATFHHDSAVQVIGWLTAAFNVEQHQ